MNLDRNQINLIKQIIHIHSKTIDKLEPSEYEWDEFETEFTNLENEILELDSPLHDLFSKINDNLNHRDVVSIASHIIDLSMLIEDNSDEDNSDEDNSDDDNSDDDEYLECDINKNIRKVYVAINNYYNRGKMTIDDVREIGNRIVNYIRYQEIPYKNVDETLNDILYQIENNDFLVNLYCMYNDYIHNGEYDLLIQSYLLDYCKLF